MRLYRALLYLYPSFYRAEYGDEMVRTFAARSRRAGGRAGRAALWLRELLDLPRSAVLVHLDVLRQDLAFALRALRRSPGFAITAILVAALGIGANTAVFSLTDQVLLRPLPFPSPERLVQLWEVEEGSCCNEVSPPNYRDWKERSHSFSALSAWHWRDGNLVGAGQPVRLQGVAVGADLLPLVGVRPLRGRLFSAADERAGAPGTLLIGHGTWQRVFGGDPDVVGRSVRFDDEAFTVIGVLPSDFAFPSRRTEFWAPIRMSEEELRRPRQQLLQGRRPARTGRLARRRGNGDGGDRRAARARASRHQRPDERRRPAAAHGEPAVAPAPRRPRRRLALRAGDRLHQPRDAAADPRHRAAQGARGARGAGSRPRAGHPAAAHRGAGAHHCSAAASASPSRRRSGRCSPTWCRASCRSSPTAASTRG